ncbi:hypothetical protein IIA15_02915 [candidate division TA06 bacterium]|nr:hypothetical protein [candidate division TA06 bacterium]
MYLSSRIQNPASSMVCHARNPSCSECFLNRLCPKLGVKM